ncbi:MAG TPA: reverse transcriptase domain-containing protein [Bryobacteraceae bacterium]|nr:reverse transcriptase domain-containing protein [Bryobacteraceae bacterium]
MADTQWRIDRIFSLEQGIYAVGRVQGFSYGFRPGRSPHQALDALNVGLVRRKVSWVLDADIRSFFDRMSHEWIMRFVQHRVADKRILRLIQKWLKAGVLEEGQWKETEAGTPQRA